MHQFWHVGCYITIGDLVALNPETTQVDTHSNMKLSIPGKSNLLCLMALAAAIPMMGYAGDDSKSTKATAAVAPAPEDPFVTGNLTINYETHFISYGQDVWGIGSSWDTWFVHPSLELDFNITKNLQFYLNLWADVNDQADTNIGKYVQEIDVNVGFYYTLDKFKFQLGYGAWNYASQTESVIEGRVTYTDPWNLSPFIALHGRVGIGSNIGFDDGLVTQFGLSPSKTWGALTLSLPITVSFDTHNYHGGDAGFAYVSAGLSASYAINKHFALNLGATYYHTDSSTIPGNPKEDFVTGLAGFTVSF